jgi:hypothetical protein
MADSNSSGGIGVVSTLGIVFIVLKLVGVIHWSWLWVLAPFWGQVLLALLILLAVWAFDIY